MILNSSSLTFLCLRSFQLKSVPISVTIWYQGVGGENWKGGGDYHPGGERSNCLTSSLISGENTFATTVAKEEKICFDLQRNWKTRRGLFQTWDTRSPEWNFELGLDKDILAPPHSQTKHYTLKLFNTGHSSGWIYTRPAMQKRFQRLIICTLLRITGWSVSRWIVMSSSEEKCSVVSECKPQSWKEHCAQKSWGHTQHNSGKHSESICRGSQAPQPLHCAQKSSQWKMLKAYAVVARDMNKPAWPTLHHQLLRLCQHFFKSR